MTTKDVEQTQADEATRPILPTDFDLGRCATVMDGGGKTLNMIRMRAHSAEFDRFYSLDGGNQWFYDVKYANGKVVVPANAIGAGVFTSGPAAVTSADGKQLHVFGRGMDNKIWRAFSHDGGSHWDLAWASIGEGVFTSSPAAALSADGKQLHVFGRGMDNKAWRAFSADGGSHWSVAWSAIVPHQKFV